jgi:hypothetical protein
MLRIGAWPGVAEDATPSVTNRGAIGVAADDFSA